MKADKQILGVATTTWSAIAFLYMLMTAYFTTGPYALAGPSNAAHDVLTIVICTGLFVQLVVSAMSIKFFKTWVNKVLLGVSVLELLYVVVLFGRLFHG